MAAIATVGFVGALLAGSRTGAGTVVPTGKPHVIVLGVDSLRLEYLRRYGGQGLTPNLDRFLSRADLVRDTTTPAARTFASWVAILTASPPVTGARFNLADRRIVSANPTIADVLRGRGYHTVYSTDEVRFANIDETYGFDQAITPPIGASDFLIGTLNELPLASVVINTRVGQVLSFSYANRGAATCLTRDLPCAARPRVAVRPAYVIDGTPDCEPLAVLCFRCPAGGGEEKVSGRPSDVPARR